MVKMFWHEKMEIVYGRKQVTEPMWHMILFWLKDINIYS